MSYSVKQTAAALTAAALIALTAGGCAPRQPVLPASSSETQSTSQSQPPESTPEDTAGYNLDGLILEPPTAQDSSAELSHGGYESSKVRFCFWQPQEQVYQTVQLAVPQEGVTALTVVQAVARGLGVDFPVNAITRHKQMLVLDLPAALVSGLLGDPQQEAIVLNSIAMTLTMNGNDVGFTVDGGQYRSSGLTLENDGYGHYTPAELKLAVTPGEYDTIRASIPYPGLYMRQFEIPDYINNPDPTAKKLADYLVMVGLPRQDFNSPEEIDPQHILQQALRGSYLYETYEAQDYQESFIYQPQLFPIQVAVQDFSLYMGEHVAQSAKLIFGNGVSVQHQSFFKYIWHPAEGVYTPPHMGGGGPNVPAILSYEDKGDRYEATVVYMQYGLDCFYVDDQPASGQKLLDYVNNRAPRHRVVVLKQGEDLRIQSIHKL